MSQLVARIPHSVQAATMRAVVRLPRPLKRLIAGKPVQLDGLTLALDAQVLLRLADLTDVALADGTAQEARAALDLRTAITVGPPLDVDARDVVIPTPDGPLPARLYSPHDVEEPAPLVVYYHGGGWVVGNLETHDYAARFLAQHAGVRLLSVDYRLAPENRFPAAVDDAVAAFDWAYKNADALGADQGRIAVAGDSAGGNLAAVVTQQTVQRGGPSPVFQALIYPEVDFTTKRPSRRLFAEGFFLTDEDMNWFEGHYLEPGTDRGDPRISPLLTADLTGLPPAYVVTAGFDPLRDNGHAYARALQEAGVPAVYRCQPDLIHGFVNFVPLGARFREAVLEIAAAIRSGIAYAR